MNIVKLYVIIIVQENKSINQLIINLKCSKDNRIKLMTVRFISIKERVITPQK